MTATEGRISVAGMHASPAAVALVRQFEGLRLEAYCCSAGVPTIGYGHTGPDIKIGMPAITVADAEAKLNADLKRFVDGLNVAVKVPLTQNQFDALVSLIFNVGPGRAGRSDGIITLANGQPSTLMRLLNAGRYQDAAAQFLRWNKATDPKTKRPATLEGLTRRRQAEMELFLKP